MSWDSCMHACRSSSDSVGVLRSSTFRPLQKGAMLALEEGGNAGKVLPLRANDDVHAHGELRRSRCISFFKDVLYHLMSVSTCKLRWFEGPRSLNQLCGI